MNCRRLSGAFRDFCRTGREPGPARETTPGVLRGGIETAAATRAEAPAAGRIVIAEASDVAIATRSEAVIWGHRRGQFDLQRPLLMGILNVTPDSFSDGGRFADPERALDRAAAMVEEGAGLIDVGGESTRPGASPVDPDDEIARVLPVVTLLADRLSVPISIDTRRASVARAALDAGADVVNDVSALADPGMARTVADSEAALVLMHMKGMPATMQDDPVYDDVVSDVASALRERLGIAMEQGVPREKIAVDPGIGFGKTLSHNLELISRLDVLTQLGRPVVLGASRKAFLGALVGAAPPQERAVATAAACVMGYLRGARVFRVHDVRIVRDALLVAEAVQAAGSGA